MWNTIMRVTYYATSLIAMAALTAVWLGWEPPQKLVAVAAFLALMSASLERNLTLSAGDRTKDA